MVMKIQVKVFSVATLCSYGIDNYVLENSAVSIFRMFTTGFLPRYYTVSQLRTKSFFIQLN